MEQATVRVYGSKSCVDTLRSVRFLQRHGVAFQMLDVDVDAEALAVVKQANGGNRVTPTIFLTDGTVLTEPSDAELGRRLGV